MIAGVSVSMNGRAGGTEPDVLCSKVPERVMGDKGPGLSEESREAAVLRAGGEMGVGVSVGSGMVEAWVRTNRI